jgi:2-succinyl-5-enolpyruvyl-6-hydroxy-3-cyclohexene-1-carboxylate synthase
MIHQVVFDTSEILHAHGVNQVVLSPGSRNAPLTISFARNKKIKKISVVDERSAAFIGLGIATKTKKPVALCCTSGSALLNYAPACAEAYYQNIQLIILSADRPANLIDQRDGQTIRQIGALNNFVKGSFNMPEDITNPDFDECYRKILNEALDLASAHPQGPVHINVPFDEPFYPEVHQTLQFRTYDKHENIELENFIDFEPYVELWNISLKKIILRGQDGINNEYEKLINQQDDAVLIADVISNIQSNKAVRNQDLFLSSVSESMLATLQPEILITSGKSIISKSLKSFLRKFKPKEHWHFEKCELAPDPFQSITCHFKTDIEDFLGELTKQSRDDFQEQIISNYHQNWNVLNSITEKLLEKETANLEFSEFAIFKPIIQSIPANCNIHLSNSMPVRYANFFQSFAKGVEIFSNRGTSGIDGSNSTAVGGALASDQLTILITGDLSFFYDRNAFFHREDMSNLRIIVTNNNGGGIFRILPDSSSLPELERYFETQHEHSAIHTAREYNFDYFGTKSMEELNNALVSFYEPSNKPKLIEVFTSPSTNHWVFKSIKAALKVALN